MADKFVDPFVAEIHATRTAMLEAVGGDVTELMRQVADRQQHSNRQIIRKPLRNRTEQGAALDGGFPTLHPRQ